MDNAFKFLKENYIQIRMIYPTKLSTKCESRVKTLSDIQSLRKQFASHPFLEKPWNKCSTKVREQTEKRKTRSVGNRKDKKGNLQHASKERAQKDSCARIESSPATQEHNKRYQDRKPKTLNSTRTLSTPFIYTALFFFKQMHKTLELGRIFRTNSLKTSFVEKENENK